MFQVKIAFVVGDLVTGGVKSYLIGYLSGLKLSKFSFDVIAYRGSDSNAVEEIEALGGHVLEVPHVSNAVAYYRSLVRLFEEGGYSIVHGMLNSLNFLAMNAARSAGVPIRIAENLSASHRLERKSLIKEVLRPLGAFGATHLMANSQLAANWMFGRKSNECRIFPNPIDLSYWTKDDEEREMVRKGLDLAGSLVIGWIGRYVPQKNPLLLLSVTRQLIDMGVDARLVMVGYGALQEDINQKIEELELAQAVIQTGATENIRPLYRAMDVFLLPSLYEGLPVVGVEAQAMGLPCVFSSEITPEVAINPNVAFVSLDASPREWAEAIIALAGNFHFDNTSIRNAGFCLDDAAAHLDEYYRMCLAEVENVR